MGLICDDQLFLKPTDAGRAMIEEVVEAPPYPGAKPSFLINGDRWDDSSWLSAAVRTTANSLPRPKAAKR